MKIKLNYKAHAVIQFLLFVVTNAVAQGLLRGDTAAWAMIIVSGLQMAFGLTAHHLDMSGRKLPDPEKENRVIR